MPITTPGTAVDGRHAANGLPRAFNPALLTAPADTARVCRVDAAQFPTHLLALLEKLFPVRFVPGQAAPAATWPVTLETAAGRGSAGTDAAATLSLARACEQPEQGRGEQSVDVAFADCAEVPPPFRGRRVFTRVPRNWRGLAVRDDDLVLASAAEGALWTRRRRAAGTQMRSALPLPVANCDTGFAELFDGTSFLALLPLLELLREVGGEGLGHRPPLRASFIVDDPNLHARRYGFVDYREVAAHAQRGRYHVSFATIPLDAWLARPAASEVFRSNPEQISLLVHGNNHAREELARLASPQDRMAALWQAIARIQHLERKTGLRVARVMVPPHGACSATVLEALPLCGFDAACVSTGSLRFHNPGEAWTRLTGFLPGDVIEGCPVLPRWAATSDFARAALLVAGYLGQPLILRGHHQDFRHGPELFDQLADFINGIGPVRWARIDGLARTSFTWRMHGSTCALRPLALDLLFEPPAGASEIRIEDLDAANPRGWAALLRDGEMRAVGPGQVLNLAGHDGSTIALRRERPQAMEAVRRSAWHASPALVLRRLLTEARDRIIAG
jgi:hypothetical protein